LNVRDQARDGIEAATRTVLATSMHANSLFRHGRPLQAEAREGAVKLLV